MHDKSERLLLKRVQIELEIEEGFKSKAADRLRNMLRANPESMFLWNMLGKLYYDSGFYDEAGKYWIMYPSNEYHVVKCIEIYRESMNHSATRILNDLKFRGDRTKLRDFSREILEELEEDSKVEGGYVYRPPIVRSADIIFKPVRHWLGSIFALFVVIGFILSLIVGFFTILSWFF